VLVLDIIVNRMKKEEIVQHILSHRDDLTRDEIIAAMEKKKVASGGLLTAEAAARLVAAELGIEVKHEKPPPEIHIGQLVSGLNDVTVSGRVLHVNAPRAFTRPSGNGQLARLSLADKTGTIKLLLWNDKAELAKKVKPRQIVKVLHGYVRRSRGGELELHIGQRGRVQVASSDVDEDSFPPIEDFLQKIVSISKPQKEVNVAGVIQNKHSTSTFWRDNGTQGKVVRVTLEDETGRVPVVFWNERVDDVAEVREGMTVLLMGTQVKERNGVLELHVKESTNVEISYQSKSALRIGDLKEGMSVAFVEGTVTSKPVIRKVKTRAGEEVAVASFELNDASGHIWVSAWREFAEKAAAFSVGTRLRLKNVYVRRGFGGQLEINTRASTAIEVVG
jgi:replication factor A1